MCVWVKCLFAFSAAVLFVPGIGLGISKEAQLAQTEQMLKLSYTLEQRGQLPQALDISRKALAVREAYLSKKAPEIGRASARVAELLARVGQYGDAIPVRNAHIPNVINGEETSSSKRFILAFAIA